MLGALLLAVQEAGADSAASGGLMTIDTIGLGLLGLFALLGLWRGLWWQVLRLVGLAAAVAVARSLESSVSGALQGRLGDLDERVVQGVTWLGLFLVTLALVALLGRLGRKVLEAMQLGLIDRVGGAVAGAATGLLLHAALLAGFVQLAPDDVLADHLHDSFSERLVEVVGIEVPLLFDSERGAEVQQRFAPFARPISIDPNGLPPGVGIVPFDTPSGEGTNTTVESLSLDPSVLPSGVGVAGPDADPSEADASDVAPSNATGDGPRVH